MQRTDTSIKEAIVNDPNAPVGFVLSADERDLIKDNFRMIFSLDGSVLPHIVDLFEVFDVGPEHADLFIDYYGSQILRLEKFGTVEAGFAQNLAYSNLVKIIPVSLKGVQGQVCVIEPLEMLLSDISRFKRRLLLMKNEPQFEDCFLSSDPAFEDETYMFLRSRFEQETANKISALFAARAAIYRRLDA